MLARPEDVFYPPRHARPLSALVSEVRDHIVNAEREESVFRLDAGTTNAAAFEHPLRL